MVTMQCDKLDDLGISCDNGECFTIDNMKNELDSILLSKNISKYGYMIEKGSKRHSLAVGPNRTAANPPIKEFTVYDRFNPASVCKLFTATAIIRSCEQNGISLDQPIRQFFPSWFNLSSSWNYVAISDLISHNSGLRGGSFCYRLSTVQAQLRSGVDANLIGSYHYENMNYAISRVLLFYLNGQVEQQGIPLENQISDYFLYYMNEYLFNPIGADDVSSTPESDESLFYVADLTSNGADFGDRYLQEGSSGLQVSIQETFGFFKELITTETYMSANLLEDMTDQELGLHETNEFDHPSLFIHNAGSAYGKGGTHSCSGNSNVCGGGIPNAGRGINCYIMQFPNETLAYLVLNTCNNDARKILIDAYNLAWK